MGEAGEELGGVGGSDVVLGGEEGDVLLCLGEDVGEERGGCGV